MNAARLEREARFALPDPTALAAAAVRLQELGVRLGRARSYSYEDVYLDTRDLRLWRAGLGLRVRREGGRTVATLKTGRVASNVADRFEWSEPVRDWRGDAAPIVVPAGSLRRGLREAGLDLRVQPIARLRVRRTVWPTRWPEGWTARVYTDHVLARVGRRRVEFAELEIESTADREAIGRAVAAIHACLPWRLVRLSKLERARAMAGRPVPTPPPKLPPALHASVSVAEAARHIFTAYWAQYTWNLPGAMAGFDPEFLHDLRVAIRRMRAAASALDSALPAGATEWVRELRPVARAAGHVRDLDIVLAWTIEPAAREITVAPAARGALARRLAAERRRRLRALRRRLSCPAHGRLCRAVPRRLRELADADSPAALKTLLERVEEARVSARATARTIDRDSPIEHFHELRIRCKVLRYRLELVRLFGTERARHAIAHLVTLQDELGRLQDLATIRTELAELRGRTIRGASAQLLDAWYARLERQMDEARQRAWTRLKKLKWRELRV